MRKMRSEDLSLDVVHPDAVDIDIGNESHYVAAPPARDRQPVRCFGCTTAELRAMGDGLSQCRIRTVVMQLDRRVLDHGLRHSGSGRFGSVLVPAYTTDNHT